MRKKVILVIVIPMILAAILYLKLTQAYLTDKDIASNKIGLVTDDHKIIEEYEKPSGQYIGDNIFKKQITVKNTSKRDQYVKVQLYISEPTIDRKIKYSIDGTHFYSKTDFKTVVEANNWDFDTNTNTFYYKKKLKPGEITAPLVSHFNIVYQNNKEIKNFDILVKSDSIQTIKEDGTDFTDYKEAFQAVNSLTN